MSHTSGEFADAITFDAITVDAFLGSTGEYGDLGYLGSFSVRARLYRIPVSGPEVQFAELATSRFAVHPGAPVHRRLVARLAEPATLEPGERLRVTIGTVAPPYYTTDPPINAYALLYTEAWTPSRVGLGTQVANPDPGSRAGCQRFTTCAEIDATHPYEGVVCGTGPFRLRWAGPAGSELVFTCDGLVTVCRAGDSGTCEMDVEPPPAADARATIHPDGSAARGGTCAYRLPDGGRGGWGRCEMLAS